MSRPLSLLPVALLAALLAAPGASAQLFEEDFSRYALGGAAWIDLPEVEVLPDAGGSGITLTITAGQDLRVYDLAVYGDGTVGGQGLIDVDWTTFDNTQGTTLWLDAPVAEIRLEAGDFGRDDDSPLSLAAYDGTGARVDSTAMDWGEGATGPFAELVVSGEGIRRAHFSSGGEAPGSVFLSRVRLLVPVAVEASSWGRVKALLAN